MRIALVFTILYLGVLTNGQAQKFKEKYLEEISELSLKQHTYALASDSLKGRSTGTDGEHKAANYIVENLKKYDLEPFNGQSYFQNIGLWSWYWGDFKFKNKQQQFKSYQDFVYLSSVPIDANLKAECVFVGDGNDSILNAIKLEGKIAFVLVNNLRSWYRVASKTKQKGAIAIIMAHQTDEKAYEQLSKQINSIHQQPNTGRQKPVFSNSIIKAFAVSANTTQQLFNIPIDKLNSLKSIQQIQQVTRPKITLQSPLIVEKANAKNVVAYLPGKDKDGETLVISAHYDHIGERHDGICVGADDNASGTATVMELAKAFAPLKGKLDKNIVFLCTTGEEKGLLGAFYFADHPKEHAFDIKANINIDMIGRIDSTHKSNYIYTIGNNHYPELDSLVHLANTIVEPLHIQYDYNKSSGFGNLLRLSDHYAFHRNGIPVIGFFSGLHKDYHTPNDTPDKIDYKEMEQRVKLIFTTAFLASQKTAFKSQTD